MTNLSAGEESTYPVEEQEGFGAEPDAGHNSCNTVPTPAALRFRRKSTGWNGGINWWCGDTRLRRQPGVWRSKTAQGAAGI